MFFLIKKFFKILSNSFYRSMFFRHQVAAGVEHEPMMKSLKLDTLLDIGANRGQFSIMARKCYAGLRIFAFEPLTSPASKIRTVFLGDSNFLFYQFAIGIKEENKEMYVSQRDDSSSLLFMSKIQEEIFPGTQLSHMEMVQITPLHCLLEFECITGNTMLKIDVQGSELRVLKGCDIFLDAIQYIYIELSFLELYQEQPLAHEVVDYLKNKDFFMIGVYNVLYGLTGEAVQADFLFKKQNLKL